MLNNYFYFCNRKAHISGFGYYFERDVFFHNKRII